MAAVPAKPTAMSRLLRVAPPGEAVPPLRDLVVALRACANRFGPEYAARKATLLRECGRCALIDPVSLLAYHDCLLFLLAYPESSRLHAAARRELVRVAAAARVDARRRIRAHALAPGQ